ncbi:YdbC family protein, partial [bacterium]|nr:YdbC family protein [bacterium]
MKFYWVPNNKVDQIVYIKWIHCEVNLEDKTSFSLSQSQWHELAQCPGFLFQIGGWCTHDNKAAYILAIWKDQSAFDYFMKHVHDKICEMNQQESSYLSCKVTFYDLTFMIYGEKDSFQEALTEASHLKYEYYYLKSDRQEHFLQVQEEVWAPMMQRSKAMLCAAV